MKKNSTAVAAEISPSTIPDAPEGFGWMLPLLDYIPAALLAGYLSAFGGSSRSIGGEEDRTDNSKIEIYI